MDSDLPHGPRRHTSITRSFNGCWTCRIRHKKCDERHPVCDACAALRVTCYYNQNKPEWMDGGPRQDEMAERLKREIKEGSHRRRGERAAHISGERVSVAEAPTGDHLTAAPDVHNATERSPEASANLLQYGDDCTLTSKDARESIAITQPDTILLMFYLEHLFPFLFPFYCPSLLRGGRAWLLEMMISSPVVRQATLCQSSYFFSLARGAANSDGVWERVLKQTRGAFEVLRQSLQIIDGLGIRENPHDAVRIMTSFIQVQRFEIAILSFNNCQAHLNAALALFKQLLDNPGTIELAGPSSSFNAIISRLGPSSSILPAQCVHIPSTEQAAFRFSSTILILDDIIASTVLQEQPKLYKYHRSLLSNIDGNDPPINLETVVGCQNWALLQIGEIAVLDAWKQQCKRTRNLNIMELVNRATAIKDSVEAHLVQLETNLVIIPKEDSSLLDVFTADYCQQLKTPASQSHLVTCIWAHAALVYLFIVVSGWQPASVDVQYHVGRIIELLTHQISPPALLRTMVWPFCVAGCLAEPAQEALLCRIVKELQPPSVFGTIRKALEIMEGVWCNRDAGDTASRDLATCFRSQGNLVLLV
jgi:C6 transcription factor Pro1